MIFIYRVFTTLIYPFLFIFIYYRKFLKKEHPERFKEKVLPSNFKINRKKNSNLIWFHAASVGEFKSIVPIIEKLIIGNNNFEILVTTTTLSSGNLATKELQKLNNVHHRFLPYDVDFLIDRFIKLWRPYRIFLVDSEIWPNLILNAKRNNISIALINARLTNKSFKRWSLFLKTAKIIFGSLDLCLCSNLETKNYLEFFKAKNIIFEGNIKLINLINRDKIKNNNYKFLQNTRFWLAASVHKEEDIICLNTHLKLKKVYSDITTIVAPRHINRVNEMKLIFDNSKLKTQILSENDIIEKDSEVIIINFFGALQEFFLNAKTVFIGKSMIERLKNDSGQNPIEAAKLNCKIYHGPYVSNFKEIYDLLKINDISFKVDNEDDLAKNLINDLQNPQKQWEVKSNDIQNLSANIYTKSMRRINNFLNVEN